MDAFNVIWIAFSILLGIAFWGLILWFAWLLVSSVRGVHHEIKRIRRLLDERIPAAGEPG